MDVSDPPQKWVTHYSHGICYFQAAGLGQWSIVPVIPQLDIKPD